MKEVDAHDYQPYRAIECQALRASQRAESLVQVPNMHRVVVFVHCRPTLEFHILLEAIHSKHRRCIDGKRYAESIHRGNCKHWEIVQALTPA